MAPGGHTCSHRPLNMLSCWSTSSFLMHLFAFEDGTLLPFRCVCVCVICTPILNLLVSLCPRLQLTQMLLGSEGFCRMCVFLLIHVCVCTWAVCCRRACTGDKLGQRFMKQSFLCWTTRTQSPHVTHLHIEEKPNFCTHTHTHRAGR